MTSRPWDRPLCVGDDVRIALGHTREGWTLTIHVDGELVAHEVYEAADKRDVYAAACVLHAVRYAEGCRVADVGPAAPDECWPVWRRFDA